MGIDRYSWVFISVLSRTKYVCSVVSECLTIYSPYRVNSVKEVCSAPFVRSAATRNLVCH
uniref:Uncharacterized protein n=1 Tax=Megaselia scalaris TaxID=36166 RepID=T1GXW2_MEGSC